MNADVKQSLLKLAENTAKEATETVFEIVTNYINKSENKMDDAFLPVLATAKEYILQVLDKIYTENTEEKAG